MKKISMVTLVLVVSLSTLCAKPFLGVNFNSFFTGVDTGMEWDHAGFDVMVGVPTTMYISSVINYCKDKENNTFPSPLSLVANPYVGINAYWRAVHREHFGLNVGLKADSVMMFSSDTKAASIAWGLSLGAAFKFSQHFGMTITGTLPAYYVLELINQDYGQYGMCIISSSSDTSNDVFSSIVTGVGSVLSEIANISFVWVF